MQLIPILLLAVGLVAATAVDARQRGSDISGSEGKDRSAAAHDSRDNKAITSKSKAKKEALDKPTAPEDGTVTYDLDVEDATVGSESTTPTADYDLEVAPGPDWDYWAREAGVIQ